MQSVTRFQKYRSEFTKSRHFQRKIQFFFCGWPSPSPDSSPVQGRNHWEIGGEGSGPRPPQKKKKRNWTDHPNFFHEACDYRYVTHCSARSWVYHPYFVLYNNLDQGIGPQLVKRGCAPAPTGGVSGQLKSIVKQINSLTC